MRLDDLERGLAAKGRLWSFSAQHLFQHLDVERLVGYQALEPPILLFQLPKPPGLRHLKTCELVAPLVERRVSDADLVAQLRHRTTGLSLLQQPDDFSSLNLLFIIFVLSFAGVTNL